LNVSSQSEIFDQIAAHTRADKRTLNATSPDGKTGGRTDEFVVVRGVCAETLLKLEYVKKSV
jgi:hypothetical protein